MRFKSIATALALMGAVAAAMAQPPPDYDFTFQTIGAPGNAPYPGNQFGTGAGWGDVAYEYRLSRLELTNSQWVEFLNAYWPYASVPRDDARLVGVYIDLANPSGPGAPNYFIRGGRESDPAETSWRFAAIYCNWLHNDKRTDQAAFTSGAYDISTFTQNADGSYNDQLTRSPGARFWIPSIDEWVKAVYYDPDRHGPGQGGYWEHPNGSDQPLVSGLPPPLGMGTTNGGLGFSPTPRPVGQYPHAPTPWGLLDASGGFTEWLEDVDNPTRNSRYRKGSSYGDVTFLLNDEIWQGLPADLGSGYGLRIASAVPSPSTAACAALVLAWFVRRRKGVT